MKNPPIGYVVSRFPKTTETFILREMDAVERHGWPLTVFAINREPNEIQQPGAARRVETMSAISDLGIRAALAAQLALLRSRPRVAAAMWWRAISGNVRSFKFLTRALVIAWGTPALADRVGRLGIRHLHAHWGTHSALLAHLISLICDVPYSVTLHAHDLHVDQTMLATKLRHSSDVVTISEHNARQIRSQFPFASDRTSVVHCGVDVNALEMGPPTGPSSNPSSPVRIVCVAGLRSFKGHAVLLDALEVLARRDIYVDVDLVGDGPLRAELEARAGSNVTFHGAVDVGRAIEIVRGATIFVLPSVELADGRRDGIPVALIESMALGVPVISSEVSGIPELITHDESGMLVQPGDHLELADAIDALLGDDEKRERLRRYARRVVERDFDIDMTGAAMSEIFAASVDGREAGRT